jgi:hypothetical protein
VRILSSIALKALRLFHLSGKSSQCLVMLPIGGILRYFYAYFHKMVNSGKQLGVYGQATVELVTWFCDQSQGEFPLEHQNCALAKRAMQEKFENKWRTNLFVRKNKF